MKKQPETIQDPQKQTVLRRPSSDRPKPLVLSQDQEAQKKLANIIFQCFQSLKLFGKEPEALESINPLFQTALAPYPIEKIQSAMTFYLRTNTEMPTPGDIAMIIERGNKPPFDRSVYVAISKMRGEDRTPEEWTYLKDYQKFIVTGEMS